MMKKYTTEEIYILTGRDDKTASVQFIPGTESYKKYGSYHPDCCSIGNK
jgi:hypothetical protein